LRNHKFFLKYLIWHFGANPAIRLQYKNVGD
jgi:hypothetical protein